MCRTRQDSWTALVIVLQFKVEQASGTHPKAFGFSGAVAWFGTRLCPILGFFRAGLCLHLRRVWRRKFAGSAVRLRVRWLPGWFPGCFGCGFHLFFGTLQARGQPQVSLDKLCQLWRQLLVKLFGSTGDPQRCGKGGTIILMIGFQRLWG
jgi:hypothetical protein